MHNYKDGVSITGGNPENHLLKVANGCRGCHDGSMFSAGAPDIFSVNTKAGTVNEAPAGSFYDILTTPAINQGNGHNPQDCGIATDTVLGKTPPGGNVLLSYSCGSCHDPHGGTSVNSYKLLKKRPGNYATDLNVSGLPSNVVTGGAQVAQSATNHNVYKSGFPEWCAGCHGTYSGTGNVGIHNTSVGPSPWLKHPTSLTLPATEGNLYGTNTDYKIPLMDRLHFYND